MSEYQYVQWTLFYSSILSHNRITTVLNSLVLSSLLSSFLIISFLPFSFLTLSSSLQIDSNSPSMSFIQAFLQQTVYLGLPDDSVRNSVVLLRLLRPTTVFFPFFLFLWYARVENFDQAEFRARERERHVEDSEGEEWMSGKFEGWKEKGVEQKDKMMPFIKVKGCLYYKHYM